jgi:tetratricopeptide (TPR) repeat protein
MSAKHSILTVALGLSMAQALVITPSTAQAASPPDREISPEATARARQLFEESVELREQGDLAGARGRLERVLEIKETPGLRYHLAHVLEEEGRLEAALAEYERAAVLIDEGRAAPDVESLLPSAISRVRAALDERAKASGRPGDGSKPVAASATPAQSEASAKESASATEISDAGSSIGAREVVLASEVGVAILGIGFGVLQSLEAGRAGRRVDAADRTLDAIAPGDTEVCADPSPSVADACRGLAQAFDDRRRAWTLATIGYAVGGLATAGFVTTFLLWSTDDERERPSARLHVNPSPDGGTFTLSGRF